MLTLNTIRVSRSKIFSKCPNPNFCLRVTGYQENTSTMESMAKDLNSLESIARDVVKLFRAKSGSDFIAQEDALVQVGRIFQDVHPKTILDLGAGIGTISFYLNRLTNYDLKFYLYEIDSYCQKALKENLRSMDFELLKSVQELEQLEHPIDLVIIDDFIDYDSTDKLIASNVPKAIFIEGHRRRQRKFVYKSLRRNNQDIWFKNFHPTPDSHKVGCIFRTDLGKTNIPRAYLSINASLFYIKIKSFQARIPFLSGLSLRHLLAK